MNKPYKVEIRGPLGIAVYRAKSFGSAKRRMLKNVRCVTVAAEGMAHCVVSFNGAKIFAEDMSYKGRRCDQRETPWMQYPISLAR